MAGSVDNVDAHLDAFVCLVDAFLWALHPRAGGSGGSDRDATLALLFHPVGDRCAFVHFTDLVDHACIEKNTLGEGSFARVDVGGDANVACALERKRAVRRVWVRGVGRGCHRIV